MAHDLHAFQTQQEGRPKVQKLSAKILQRAGMQSQQDALAV